MDVASQFWEVLVVIVAHPAMIGVPSFHCEATGFSLSHLGTGSLVAQGSRGNVAERPVFHHVDLILGPLNFDEANGS